jgi:cytochrome c oxidase assembly protein Cox11
MIAEFLQKANEAFIMFIGLLGLVSMIYLAFARVPLVDLVGVVALDEYDATTKITCGSKSMGLVVGCNDRALLREIPVDSALIEGHIYIYAVENRSVIHRFLGCQDGKCEQLIFHGDNNRVAEIIPRENVTYEVVGVLYAR